MPINKGISKERAIDDSREKINKLEAPFDSIWNTKSQGPNNSVKEFFLKYLLNSKDHSKGKLDWRNIDLEEFTKRYEKNVRDRWLKKDVS